MSHNSHLIDQCTSFEWRGPYHSLTRVDGDNVDVIRSRADWSDVVGGKPVSDNRNNNLADLFPRPRAILARVIDNLQRDNDPEPKKVNGPGF